jgi:hypothetical protein
LSRKSFASLLHNPKQLVPVPPETPCRTSLSSHPKNPGLKYETWATHEFFSDTP